MKKALQWDIISGLLYPFKSSPQSPPQRELDQYKPMGHPLYARHKAPGTGWSPLRWCRDERDGALLSKGSQIQGDGVFLSHFSHTKQCGVNPVSEQKPVLQEYGGWSSQPSRRAAGDPSQQTVTDGGIQKVNMEDGESIFSSPILLDPFPFSLSSLKPMDQTWDASSHSGHAHCGEQRWRLPLGLCVTHTN